MNIKITALITLLCVFCGFPAIVVATPDTYTISGTLTLPTQGGAEDDIHIELYNTYNSEDSAVAIIEKGQNSTEYQLEIAVNSPDTQVSFRYVARYSKNIIGYTSVYIDAEGATSLGDVEDIVLNADKQIDITLMAGNKTIKGKLLSDSLYAEDDISLEVWMNPTDYYDMRYYASIAIPQGQELEYEFQIQAETDLLEYVITSYVISRNNIYTERSIYYTSDPQQATDDENQATKVQISSTSNNPSFDFPLEKSALIETRISLANGRIVPPGYYTIIEVTAYNLDSGFIVTQLAYITDGNSADFNVGIPQSEKNGDIIFSCRINYSESYSTSLPNPLPSGGGSPGGGGSSGGGGGIWWLPYEYEIYYPSGQLYNEDLYYSDDGLTLYSEEAKIFDISSVNAENVNITLMPSDYIIGGVVGTNLTIPDGGLSVTVSVEDATTGEVQESQTVTIPENSSFEIFKFELDTAGDYLLTCKVNSNQKGYDNRNMYYCGFINEGLAVDRTNAKVISIGENKPMSLRNDMTLSNAHKSSVSIRFNFTLPNELSSSHAPINVTLYSLDGSEIKSAQFQDGFGPPVVTTLSKFIVGYALGNGTTYYQKNSGSTRSFNAADVISLTHRSGYSTLQLNVEPGFAEGINNNLTIEYYLVVDENDRAIVAENSATNKIKLVTQNEGAAQQATLFCIQYRNGIVHDVKRIGVNINGGNNVLIEDLNFDLKSNDWVDVFVWEDDLKPMFRL